MVSNLFLQRFVPFNLLSDELLDEASRYISIMEYKSGELVFKRGKTLTEKFYLLNGAVDLVDNRFNATKFEAGHEGTQLALNQGLQTQHAVRVHSDKATIFSIDENYLAELMSRSEVNQGEAVELSEGEDWMANLLSCPLFSLVPNAQIVTLFSSFATREVSCGEVIIKEGEYGDYFYVLADGTATVTTRTSSSETTLGVGQYFGEEALVARSTRNATITMTSDGTLKVLDEQMFAEVLKKPILRYIKDQNLVNLTQPYQLVDVRMPIEYKFEHLPGSLNIPLPRLRDEMKVLPNNRTYVVLEDLGGRANVAAHLMSQAGFDALILQNKPLTAA